MLVARRYQLTHLHFTAAAVPNNNYVVTSSSYCGGNVSIALPIPSFNGGGGNNETTTVNYPSSSPGMITCIPIIYTSTWINATYPTPGSFIQLTVVLTAIAL